MAAKKAKVKKSPRPAKKSTATKKQSVAAKSVAKKQAVKKIVTKKATRKPATRKSAKPKTSARQVAPARTSAHKPSVSPNRPSWIDELTQTPLIDDYARQLESFISAMADGRVDENEVTSQEKRVVKLLKEIDPQLGDALHAKVTQLLCEMTAYAIMQMLYAMEQTRPKTVFQG
jgi:hypothetical protein